MGQESNLQLVGLCLFSCLGGTGRPLLTTPRFSQGGLLVGRGWEAHHSWWGYDSALLPGSEPTRLQGLQNSSFEELSRADLHPTKFPGHTTPSTCSANEQRHRLGLLRGLCKWEFGLPRLSAGGISPFSITSRFPVVEPHRVPSNPRG